MTAKKTAKPKPMKGRKGKHAKRRAHQHVGLTMLMPTGMLMLTKEHIFTVGVTQLAAQLGMSGDELINRLVIEACHGSLHLDESEAAVVARVHKLFPSVIAAHEEEHNVPHAAAKGHHVNW